MIDARHKNKAGYTFVLWSENPYVEIFRPADLKNTKLSDAIPFEVILLGMNYRSENGLKKIANEFSDYMKMV